MFYLYMAMRKLYITFLKLFSFTAWVCLETTCIETTVSIDCWFAADVHGGHGGWQKQKRFSPLGTWFFFVQFPRK